MQIISNEASYNKRAILISVFIHVLIIGLTFLIIFHPPNPPLSESGNGVELNFGMDDVGSGDFQSYNPSGQNNLNEKPLPGEPEKQKATPPQVNTPQEESQKNDPQQEEEVLTTKDETAPVVNVPKKEQKKKEVNPKEEVKTEKALPKVETKPVINNNALFKKNTGAGGKDGGTGGGGSNEGDDKGKTGNKGKPDGDLDGRAYFGKKGKGGNGEGNGIGNNGSSLDMSGWTWSVKPKVNDKSDEEGKIVLEVKVNEDGDVADVKTIESTVSPALVELYKNEVKKINFIQTDSRPAPTISKGRITFIIRSK